MSRPAPIVNDEDVRVENASRAIRQPVGLEEVEAIKDFGNRMEAKGLFKWWKQSLGWKTND